MPERETGGRTAYDRFDFQTAWGISQVLRLHTAGANYAVAFEFHDDIIELDDADTPANAAFYQLKTRDKNVAWTVSELVERPASSAKNASKRKASFARKMFDNLLRFNDAVRKLVFVSNQPVSGLAATYGEWSLSAADDSLVTKFVTAMGDECQKFSKDKHLDYFHFDYCTLNLGSYEEALIGRVDIFLYEQYSLDRGGRAFALYLANEGKRRSKALSDVSSFEELKRSKFLTRNNLERWIFDLIRDYEGRPNLETIVRQLKLTHPDDTKFEREWNNYLSERMRRWTAATLEFAAKVKIEVEPLFDAAEDLKSGLVSAVPVIRDLVRAWKPGASDHFIKAVALYEYKR